MSSLKSLVYRFPEVPIVALLIAVDLVLAQRSTIDFRGFAVLLLPSLVLGTVWVWYATRGRDARLSELAYYPLMLLLASVGGAVLSYLVVDRALPTYDDVFAKMDAALFFYWPDWLAFRQAHPWYGSVLQVAYDSWCIQLYGSAFFFALRGLRQRNRELLRIALVSSALTVAVFWCLPALGPFFYFSVAPKLESLMHLPYLRAGAAMTINLPELQGLISFPSFHTVMAVAFVYVHRCQGNLFRAVAALNAVMLLATIVCGAHYLVDLIGGLAVATVSIALVRMTMVSRSVSSLTSQTVPRPRPAPHP